MDTIDRILEQKNEQIEQLLEENKELKTKINKVIELFNEWNSSDLYDYIDDLDYYETEVELEDTGII